MLFSEAALSEITRCQNIIDGAAILMFFWFIKQTNIASSLGGKFCSLVEIGYVAEGES